MKALFTPFPIVSALLNADDFIADVVWQERKVETNAELVWQSENDMQAALVDREMWTHTLAALSGLAHDEIESVANWDAAVINTFLQERGYTIQLRQWPHEDRRTFGFAAALKLLRYWQVPGDTGYVVLNWRKAFRLGADAAHGNVQFARAMDQVVVQIPTSVQGDSVMIVKAPGPLSHFPLLHYCMEVAGVMQPTDEFSGAVLPQWVFQEEVDVSDMIGLSTTDAAGERWALSQALMEGKSAFGPAGTSFKAAFAAAATRGMSSGIDPQPRDHIVDYDLVMWIARVGVPVPLGAVYVTTEEFSSTNVTLEE